MLVVRLLSLSIFGCECDGQIGGTFDADIAIEAAVEAPGRGVEAGCQQRSLIRGRARRLGGRTRG